MGSEFGNEATLEPPLSSQIIRAIRVIRGSILPFDYGSSPEGDLRVVPTKLKDLLTADYPPSPWDGLRRGERGSDGWATKIRNPKHEARNNIECSKLKDLSTADPPTPRLRRDRSPGSDGWATKIRNPKHEARNNIECSKLKDLLTADPPTPRLRRDRSPGSDGWATKIRNPKHEARNNIECSKLKDLLTADPPTPRLRRDRSPGSDGWATKIRNPKHEARNNIECSKLKDLLTADYPPSPWDGLRRGELRSDGWEPERVGFLAAPAFSLIRVIRVIRGSILPFQ